MPHLRLNLAAADEAERHGWVRRPLAHGLVAVPSYVDADGEMRVVCTDEIDVYGASETELLGAAELSGYTYEPAEVVRRDARSGPVLWGIVHHHPYVCTALWRLPDIAKHIALEGYYDPEQGLLVTIPTRSHLYFHRIGNADLDAAMVSMATLGFLAHRFDDAVPEIHEGSELPQRVSRELYWFRQGELVHVPTTVAEVRNGIGVNVDPPAELRALA